MNKQAASTNTKRNHTQRLADTIERTNRHLLIALAIAFGYHGSLLFFTFKRTYDAYVHIFFADHYARAWFDHWEYRWYTGFPMTSYPPGSQQLTGLLSHVVGLQNGFILVQLCATLLLTIGVYRFSKIWVSEEAAGYAALLAVFSSSITETIHVFGQLPTTVSLSLLLNALPYAYQWLKEGRINILFVAWAVNAATTAGHHVTTLFGAVFFVAPVMGLAILEKLRTPLPDESPLHPNEIRRQNFRPIIVRRLRRITPVVMRCGVYGVGLITLLVFVVLPYWLWSKNDPITQVSIPHASRDSFIENPNAGLVFWLVPYGLSLFALPYAFYKGMITKAWPLTLSLGLLFVLGTGGTTPIPRLLLRAAFDILTLDRFTFWATIVILPLFGEFIVSLRHRNLAYYLRTQLGKFTWYSVQIGFAAGLIAFSLLVANLTQFRRFQPEPIDMQPIVNFIEKDEHWRWRYMTLGFGDQMAWLSAQTTATSVDGNYHSARRLPELTTTPVERLEGAKFRGIPGIGSLQQFLAVPDKYNLKFVFSADEFYDPLLHFSGWHRLGRLENGIMVWEREDIPPLPEILPRKEIPLYQRAMWGIVPLTAMATAAIAMSAPLWGAPVRGLWRFLCPRWLRRRFRTMGHWWLWKLPQKIWLAIDGKLAQWSMLPTPKTPQTTPQTPSAYEVWRARIQRVPRPKPAPPTVRQLRTAVLLIILLATTGYTARRYIRHTQTPTAIVEAYYDDLDFRRFGDAYDRLDPHTRPSFAQYTLQLSVNGGLMASYAKLDSIRVTEGDEEGDGRMTVEATTSWITALSAMTTTQEHTLIHRAGNWYIEPEPPDIIIPPDQFFRQGNVAWGSQERRRVTTETTAFKDVQERPELEILSARLVEHNGRCSIVGELINNDITPADVTVAAYLYDEEGEVLTWYNAQTIIAHKIYPKEVTPFRIDFEGVAGAVLQDAPTDDDASFAPEAYTPLNLHNDIANFEVYAKAVVTSRDLSRNVGTQNVIAIPTKDGDGWQLEGELINNGPVQAVIPHVLATFYDENGRVAWVDHQYQENGLRPQRAQPLTVPLIAPNTIETIIDRGDLYANILENNRRTDTPWLERIPLPPETGFASYRLMITYFTANEF